MDSPARQSISDPDPDTLLITVDRLTETADVLGVFRRPGEPIPVSANLHLLVLDRVALLEQSWAEFIGILNQAREHTKVTLPGLDTVAGIDSGELSTLPGVDDFLLLKRIRDEAISGRWRRLIVDCSGVADPFDFLRSASVLSQMLNRLWPKHRRLAAAADKPALAELTAAVEAIDRDCLDVAEVLTDPHTTAVHLVVGADRRGRRLLGHQLATIDLMGLPLASVLLNHLAESDGAESLDATTPGSGLPVTTVPFSADPLDRAARLRKLRVSLPEPSGRPLGSAAAQVSTVSGSGTATLFELAWPQRLPDPDTLQLGRSGDDLVVTVSGFRHPVRLPSVLRRCIVVDAAWNGSEVTIRFRPDPALWPRG